MVVSVHCLMASVCGGDSCVEGMNRWRVRLFGLKEELDTRIGVVLLGGSRATLQTNQGANQLLTGPLAQSYMRLGVEARGL